MGLLDRLATARGYSVAREAASIVVTDGVDELPDGTRLIPGHPSDGTDVICFQLEYHVYMDNIECLLIETPERYYLVATNAAVADFKPVDLLGAPDAPWKKKWHKVDRRELANHSIRVIKKAGKWLDDQEAAARAFGAPR